MKNVAKCDTWCELQNPANHRVFERKLRPRPLGRGHACLGVTPKHAPNHPLRELGCGIWSLVLQGAVGRRSGCRRTASDTAHGGRPCFINAVHPTRRRHHGLETTHRTKCTSLRPRPQVRRDYPLSLSI
ncbi:hypothetical protein D1007_18164 [Hordeum vulgare]|nr:hypothetical protein D1007_18164 [Hordeum vulgare]